MKTYLSHYLSREFAIYLVIGSITYLIDIGVFTLFFSVFNLWYIAAKTVSTLISLLFNFTSHRKITFKSDGKHKDQIPRYILLAIFNYIVSIILLYLFVEKLFIAPEIANVITLGVIAMYNFLVLKKLIFPV